MIKKYLAVLLLSWSCLASYSQYLTQSADGKSSIPLPLQGVGIGIDIGKTELTFGVNNYERVLKSVDNKLKHTYLIGLNLSAKNSEGIGNLFSSGDIVPAGSFLGFAGFSLSNTDKILAAWKRSPANSLLVSEQDNLAELRELYRADIINSIDLCITSIKKEEIVKKIKEELTTQLKAAPDALAINKVIAKYKEKDVEELKIFWTQMDELIAAARKKYIEKFDRKEFTKNVDAAFKKFFKENWPVRFTPFILGGIDARNFSLFVKPEPLNFSNSFKDTLFRGGNIGFGINLQVRNFWLGITYAYVNGDNFVNLKSKEYTVRTVDTSGNQSLISEKKTTAYSGKYSKVEYNVLNADLVTSFYLNDSSRLMANLYVRGSVHSRDTAYLKNYTNIGLGLYFTGKKSAFLGGLYVELPDINNNIEKAKPVAERNTLPPLKKLSFGIVTKISLSSILGMVNRPRTPDPS